MVVFADEFSFCELNLGGVSMEAFMGTILGFGFNFAPRGWQLCYGQTLAISQQSALFSLLGTTYGGNGQSTFQLPNLQGRTPVGQGNGGGGVSPYALGQVGGTETTVLNIGNIPAHNHSINVNTAAAAEITPGPTMYLGQTNGSDPTSGDSVTVNIYTPTAPNAQLAPTTMGMTGNNQPFSNLQPYLAINYAICLEGIWPSRN